MVHFVGAGPGAPDLITQRGAALLRAADVVIYAGSLVNPALLGLCRQDCSVYNSAQMTLEQVLEVVRAAHAENRDIVRLHTGDPCLYGAIREQMDALDALGWPGGWRRSYPARPRAAAKAARWTPGQPTPLPTRTRLSMWARRASRCAPSRLMPGIRRRTRPWWRWTNAAASRCRC